MQAQEQRSVLSLLMDISHSIENLIRSEIKLAKAEGRNTLEAYEPPAKTLASGSVLLLYSVGFLLSAAAVALQLWLPLWASLFLVGVAVGVVGAGIVMKGWSQLSKLSKTGPQVDSNG